MSSKIWVCWKRTAFECKPGVMADWKESYCICVLVASCNLGSLLLQHLPFSFQHWSSKLVSFMVLEIGNCRLGPLCWNRTRSRSTGGLDLCLILFVGSVLSASHFWEKHEHMRQFQTLASVCGKGVQSSAVAKLYSCAAVLLQKSSPCSHMRYSAVEVVLYLPTVMGKMSFC